MTQQAARLVPPAKSRDLYKRCGTLSVRSFCQCRLSDRLEVKTQEARRFSKDYEGACVVQDAGMQTLEVPHQAALFDTGFESLQSTVQ